MSTLYQSAVTIVLMLLGEISCLKRGEAARLLQAAPYCIEQLQKLPP